LIMRQYTLGGMEPSACRVMQDRGCLIHSATVIEQMKQEHRVETVEEFKLTFAKALARA
jgi:hypothetical protein